MSATLPPLSTTGPPAATALQLQGPARVLLADRPALVLAPREAALLAWLQLEGPVARARIAGLLWPGGTEAQARANLRQLLSRLRRAAGELVQEDDGLLQLAAGLPPQPDDPRPLLEGLAFDDAPELAAWLAAQREQALRRRQRLQLQVGHAALAAGQLDAALEAADSLLAAQPENEEAWRLRMQTLAQRGDRAQALQAWDDCRHALRAAFGVPPSAATQALGERLLADSAAPLPRLALPESLRRPPQLVGREAELQAVLRNLALGHGVVVLGPAGIGKSRLLADAAERFAPVLAVAARPGDAVSPGTLLARLLAAALQRFEPALAADTRRDVERLLPPRAGDGGEPPAALRSALEHRRVLASAARCLAACHARGLRALVLDDLQFADDASLAALQVIAGQGLVAAPDEAAPLLLAARHDELPPAASALIALLSQSGRAARVDLRPLDAAQLRELLRGLALPGAEGLDRDALAAALHARVGGLPAFVLESLRSLWLERLQTGEDWPAAPAVPVPPTLREAVRRRLDRLSPEALQLAQLAAVAGGDFSIGLATVATGRTTLALAPPLTELASAQVFDGQRFGHDLVAEAVAASVPGALARALHAQVAAYLMGWRDSAARVAFHLDRAGQPRQAAPWHLQAAQAMRARWQMHEAARAFETAAAALDPVADREQVTTAWREAARCWLLLSRDAEAERALDRAEPLARGARERVLLRSIRATVQFNASRYGAAADSAQAVAAELPATQALLDAEELAQVLLSAALAAPYIADAEPLLQACEAVRPRGAERPMLAARVDFAAGMTLGWLGRPLQAHEALERGWATAQAHDLRGECVNLGNQLIRCAELRGELDDALQACERTRSAIEHIGAGAGFEADLLSYRALLLVSAGRPGEALAAVQQLLRLRGAAALSAYEALRLALLQLPCGRPEAAAAALQQCPAPATGPSPLAAHRAWALARCEHAAGRDPAAALAQAASACPAPHSQMGWRGQVLQALVGRPAAQPLAEIEALLPTLEQRGLRALQRSAAMAAARQALHEDRPQRARQHAETALALARCVDPWCDEPASVWREAAEVFDALDLAAAAAQARRAGAQWVRDAAATLPHAADRDAWCEGNPVHRALLRGPR
ncbi:ATP-binding protein [Aquabacterium sp.]|uniref:ATP-binding protein n=1 Tax=Aquabacterium sp. TaxID=1872578 RepID=UPI003782D562